jgi:nondiscriminating glutamyl-tRNA synthetase
MRADTVRTRFAPSPTGRIHVGNLRTALFAALLARRHQGSFVLRIEDTDAARHDESVLADLYRDLEWFGLEPDEGPEQGGGAGPYRQSERGAHYQRALDAFRESGQAYPCFCSREALETSRRLQMAAGRPPRYDGRCAGIPPEEAQARLNAGETSCWRFRVPAGDAITFTDLVHGEQRFDRELLGDFVIMREDATPAFLFGNALDDAAMRVTHVLRGEDHLANTPRQLLLLEALDQPAPAYGHLPLVLGDDGRPLGKRNGAATVQQLRHEGILPLALWNLLARIGHHYENDDLLDRAALESGFDLAHIGRAAAHFDSARLEHWQKQAVTTLDDDSFRHWAGIDATGTGAIADAIALLRENVTRPEQAREWLALMQDGPPSLDADALASAGEAGAVFFAAAVQASECLPDDYPAFTRSLSETTGRKGAALFRPLRAALTGRLAGPEIPRLMAILGRERIRQRFERFT